MILPLAHRLQHVQPSATLAFMARVNQLKAEGHDIINLTIGEPDFDTPLHIKEAAKHALDKGFTKYTAVDGIVPLKQAIIQKLATENNLTYDAKQIVVSNGSKQCIYNLAQALLNPGDEVIIPAPYWVSYPDIIYLAEAKPVIIATTIEQQFKITPEQLEAAITPRTRLVILNSPSNPTGMVYSVHELKQLADVLLRHPQVIIASDDIYEHILWSSEPFANIINACPALYERTVILNGVSKAYAMTGWRIGYAAGPPALITAMTNVQSQSTSNANSIAQIAAQTALIGEQTSVRTMCAAYKNRHDIIYQGLQNLSGFQLLPSEGAFYTFPSIHALLGRIPNVHTDAALADYFLNNAGVAFTA
jgi:aspartate aminotransferase